MINYKIIINSLYIIKSRIIKLKDKFLNKKENKISNYYKLYYINLFFHFYKLYYINLLFYFLN